MALIVEDGTLTNPDANSYNTRAELIAYAVMRGVVLVDDDTTDVLAIKAMDYLESFREQYKGELVDPDTPQPLSWPRDGVQVGSVIVGTTVIPRGIKTAQCQLVVEQKNGVVVMPTYDPNVKFITKKQLGPIVTEFSEAVALAGGTKPDMPLVDALVEPYINGGAGPTRSYRV